MGFFLRQPDIEPQKRFSFMKASRRVRLWLRWEGREEVCSSRNACVQVTLVVKEKSLSLACFFYFANLVGSQPRESSA